MNPTFVCNEMFYDIGIHILDGFIGFEIFGTVFMIYIRMNGHKSDTCYVERMAYRKKLFIVVVVYIQGNGDIRKQCITGYDMCCFLGINVSESV